MTKNELIEELKSAKEQLKKYNKFIDLLREEDDPKGFLTKLNRTISRIDMLIEANDIKELAHPRNKALENPFSGKIGDLVKVRPCDEEYQNKTYLGFLIGDVARGSSIGIENDKIQLNFSGYNPAMFVPELKKIIYGAGSWWSKIDSVEELKDITNDDIENVWYVKLLQDIVEK